MEDEGVADTDPAAHLASEGNSSHCHFLLGRSGGKHQELMKKGLIKEVYHSGRSYFTHN